MHAQKKDEGEASATGRELVRPSVADFTREIDHVAVPKGDRLFDGLANWNAIFRTFTAAPLATAVVVIRNGRRSRDEHSHGRCGEKRGSHDTLHFHSSPLKWWCHTRRAVLGTTRRCFGDPSHQRPRQAFGMELVQQLLEGSFSCPAGRRHALEIHR